MFVTCPYWSTCGNACTPFEHYSVNTTSPTSPATPQSESALTSHSAPFDPTKMPMQRIPSVRHLQGAGMSFHGTTTITSTSKILERSRQFPRFYAGCRIIFHRETRPMTLFAEPHPRRFGLLDTTQLWDTESAYLQPSSPCNQPCKPAHHQLCQTRPSRVSMTAHTTIIEGQVLPQRLEGSRRVFRPAAHDDTGSNPR